MAAKYENLDLSEETDSSEDDDDDEEEEENVNVREKRDLESSRDKSGLESLLKPGTVLDPAHAGNPDYGFIMQLLSSREEPKEYRLAILPSGKVRGFPDSNKFTVVEFSSAGCRGHVRIRGVESNLYLAMNANGRLYGEKNLMEEGTIFEESVSGSYKTYLSKKYRWYVGIKKSGKPKNGKKTKAGQKAIQFSKLREKSL